MQTDVANLAVGLYEALLDGTGLLPALRGLAARVGASSHAVHMIHYRQGRPTRCVSAGHGGVAGAPLEDYARYWVRHDPWARVGGTLVPGVHDIARSVPAEALRRSRIWNEWGRPNDAGFHALGVPLLREDDSMGGVFFHRREGEVPFDGGDRALLEAIFPHLRRAFAAEAQLSAVRDAPGTVMRAGLDALADGVALLDGSRRTIFVNAPLKMMFDRQDGLMLGLAGLEAPDPAVSAGLDRAVTAALAAANGKVGLLPSAGSLALPRPSGLSPWLVRAVPVMPTASAELLSGFRGAMLLVQDGERRARPAAALLGRIFGLTGAEAALAASLAEGRSLDDHAKRRQVSRETVRTQLAAVRRKTGCRRQIDLAALFARLPG